MFRWLEELYEIRRRNREVALFCPTCEALKVELAAERREKEMLLHKLLNTTNEPQPESTGNPVPVVARHRPWRVIQQELETKDRAEAERIMREFKEKSGITTQPVQPVPIPVSRTESVARVERELGIDG
jgi:hypothetical protein